MSDELLQHYASHDICILGNVLSGTKQHSPSFQIATLYALELTNREPLLELFFIRHAKQRNNNILRVPLFFSYFYSPYVLLPQLKNDLRNFGDLVGSYCNSRGIYSPTLELAPFP